MNMEIFSACLAAIAAYRILVEGCKFLASLGEQFIAWLNKRRTK